MLIEKAKKYLEDLDTNDDLQGSYTIPSVGQVMRFTRPDKDGMDKR